MANRIGLGKIRTHHISLHIYNLGVREMFIKKEEEKLTNVSFR